MSDDIDIEEHDVLDNPLIRDIFPDLSKVKTEPLYYIISDEETEVDGSNDFLDVNHDSVSSADNGLLYEPPITTNEHTFQTKLIIGSKPPQTPTQVTNKSDNLDAFVILDDWGPELYASACFCKECKILFPTENDLHAHKESAHSFLVAVDHSRNKAVKSTAKGNVIHPLNQKLCNHCNTYFPDDDCLVQHLYELLPLSNFPCDKCGLKFHSKNELEVHKKVHNTVDVLPVETDHEEVSQHLCLICSICGIVLLRRKPFLTHMKTCHRMLDVKPIKRRIPKTCKFCPRAINQLSSHSKHVRQCHLDKYNLKKPVVKQGDNLESNKKFTCLEGKLIKMPQNLTTIQSPVKNNDKLVKVDKTKTTLIPDAISKIKQMPIPDATLFKCSKCSVHFVSCLQVRNHERRCSKNQKKKVDCKFCSRLFTKTDILRHYIQHKYTKKFVVFTYNSKLYRGVVTKCSDCNAYFDELSLRKHYPLCNKKSVTTNCVQCHIPMTAKDLHHHYQLHQTMKLKSKDFIKLQALPRNGYTNHKIVNNEVDFKQSSNESASVRPSKSLIRRTKSTSVKSDGKKQTLYYCHSCECYLRLPWCHSACSITRKKFICKKCGLVFTCSNNFVRHQKLHETVKVQLSDFEFKSYGNKKLIVPPIPTYYKCAKRCKVSFDTIFAANTHDCSKVDSVKCELCGNKYIPELYSLHLAFHHYSTKSPTRTKLVHNEYSDICIQFLCSECRVVTDSYDGAVEHCQNHLNNNINNKAEILCCTCNYRVYKSDYDRHKMVHLQNSAVRLIKFEHANLLTEKWKETFSELPKNEFDKILSRSIYQYDVNFKMQVVQDGDASLTVHQCGQCKRYVDRKHMNGHILSCSQGIIQNCRHCKACDMYFGNDEEVHKHLKMHSSNLDLRIVRYNCKDDVLFNAKLSNKMVKKRKFVVYKCKKCTCCIINKINIRRHTCSLKFAAKCKMCMLYFINMSNHRVYHSKHPDFVAYNIKIIEFNPPQFRNHSKVEQNAVLYKCTCELHFPSLNAFETHVKICKTRPNQAIESSFCSKCNLLFPTNLLVAHSITHHSNDTVKQFIVKTIDCVRSIDALDENDEKCQDNSDDDFQTIYDKKINAHNHQKDFVRNAKVYNLYKCSLCKLHFVNATALLRHAACNCRMQTRMMRPMTCNLCGFKFTPSSLASHKRHHHANKSTKCKFNVIVKKLGFPMAKNSSQIYKELKEKIKLNDSPKIEYNSKNNKKEKQKIYLYKCYKCSVCFFTVRAHGDKNVIHENCDDVVFDECKICKLKIIKSVLEKHVEYHHAPNVQITVVEVSKNKFTDDIPTKAYPGSRVLHRCEGFGAHFIRFGNLVRYIKQIKNTKGICYTCPECGYDFAANIIRAHIKSEHVKHKFQRNDYTVKTYSLQSILSNVKDSVEVESDVETLTEEESNVVDTTTQEPNIEDTFNIEEENNASINLYRCPICDISFITRKTCHCHAVYWDHSKVMQTVRCEMCKATFSKKSYGLHKAQHHKNGPIHDIEVEEIWKTPHTENLTESKIYKVSLRVQSMAISTTTGDNDLEMVDTGRGDS